MQPLRHAIDVLENAFMPWPIFMPHGCPIGHEGFMWINSATLFGSDTSLGTNFFSS